MTEQELERTEEQFASELEKDLTDLFQHEATEAKQVATYVTELEEGEALAELEDINQQLAAIKGKVGEYLSKTLSWKESVNLSSKAKDRNALQTMFAYVGSALGKREKFENMSMGEQVNMLFLDFEQFSSDIASIRDSVQTKRDATDSHLKSMRERIREAVPDMVEAEKSVISLEKEKQGLEERLGENLGIQDKVDLQEELDILNDEYLVARRMLRTSTYTVQLSQNVMTTLRTYKDNLDILLNESEAMVDDINLTTKTIKPLMGTIVSGAKIAEALTKGLGSYKVLQDVVNPVLMKTAEIGAVIEEAREDTMDGTFIREDTIEHLQNQAQRAKLISNYRTIRNLKNAREELRKQGIIVEEVDRGYSAGGPDDGPEEPPTA